MTQKTVRLENGSGEQDDLQSITTGTDEHVISKN